MIKILYKKILLNVLIVEVKIVKNMKPYNGLEVFTILFYIKKNRSKS